MSLTVNQARDPRQVATAVSDLQVSGAGLVTDGSITTAKLNDAAVTAAKLADSAVTAAKLHQDTLKSYVVAAGNGAGARTMTGAKVGDVVVQCFNHTDGTNDLAAGDVEATVSVADQLQQLQTNHTGDKWLVLVIAKGT